MNILSIVPLDLHTHLYPPDLESAHDDDAHIHALENGHAHDEGPVENPNPCTQNVSMHIPLRQAQHPQHFFSQDAIFHNRTAPSTRAQDAHFQRAVFPEAFYGTAPQENTCLLPLAWQRYGTFFVDESNTLAYQSIHRTWWPNNILWLWGPPACGKSHLAHIWQHIHGPQSHHNGSQQRHHTSYAGTNDRGIQEDHEATTQGIDPHLSEHKATQHSHTDPGLQRENPFSDALYDRFPAQEHTPSPPLFLTLTWHHIAQGLTPAQHAPCVWWIVDLSDLPPDDPPYSTLQAHHHLFSFLEAATKRPCLILSRQDPETWYLLACAVHAWRPWEDVRSRLRSLLHVHIGFPQAPLWRQCLQQRLQHKGWCIPPHALRYLQRRLPRTFAAIHHCLSWIETCATYPFSIKSLQELVTCWEQHTLASHA